MAETETTRRVKEIRWQPHKHCPVCGNAMPPDKEYCSTKCENLLVEYKKEQRKKNRWIYAILLPVTAVLVLFILLQFGA
ncbi:MAG: DUF2116 family Zn-ribbon domain-containing protein [Candidatus Ranarchaeia archaeon]